MTNSSPTAPPTTGDTSSSNSTPEPQKPTFGIFPRPRALALSATEAELKEEIDDCARWAKSMSLEEDACSVTSSQAGLEAGSAFGEEGLKVYKADTARQLDDIASHLESILTVGGRRLAPRPAHLYPRELYTNFLNKWNSVQWLGARLLDSGINLEADNPAMYRYVALAAEQMECDHAAAVARLMEDVEGYYTQVLRGYGALMREEEGKVARLRGEIAGDMGTLEARLEVATRELWKEKAERMALEKLIGRLPGDVQRELAVANKEVLTAKQRARWGIP